MNITFFSLIPSIINILHTSVSLKIYIAAEVLRNRRLYLKIEQTNAVYCYLDIIYVWT
jgi:hypothetical protein